MSEIDLRDQSLDRKRIDYLVESEALDDLEVTIVGLGSGGFPLMQQLAMLGIRRWNLFDHDILEAHNLVKHPSPRADLGLPKVEIAAAWLKDRNPQVLVDRHVAEVTTDSDALETAVSRSSLLLCAVDNPGARAFLNEMAVRQKVPCATGLVFRTGMGGSVYMYIPDETGCYACLDHFTDQNDLQLDTVIDLTDDERHHIYGLGQEEYSASGLATDITMIASLHAAMATSLLVGSRSAMVAPLAFNWLTFGMRQVPGAFASRFETERAILRPQSGCYLNCSSQNAALQTTGLSATDPS